MPRTVHKIAAAAMMLLNVANAPDEPSSQEKSTDCNWMPINLLVVAPCDSEFSGKMIFTSPSGSEYNVDILRSGSWQFERYSERGGRSVYADYASGVSIAINEKGTNGGRELSIGNFEFSRKFISTQRKGRVQELLGKKCEIREFYIEASIRPDQVIGCFDDAGAPLSQEIISVPAIFPPPAELPKSKVTMIEFGAPPMLAEVRPPDAIFSWAYWGITGPSDVSIKPSYEVRLEDQPLRPLSQTSLTIKSHGNSRLTIRRQNDKIVSMQYEGSDGRASYSADSAGRPRGLGVGPGIIRNEPRYAATGAVERILGEECHWMTYAIPPLVIVEGTSSICLTTDGIPLAMLETSHGMTMVNSRAVSLRRHVNPTDLVPPREIIQRRTWIDRD